MKTGDISSCPALPEWTLIRGAHWWFTGQCAHSAGVTSLEATASPPAEKPPSEWVMWAIQSRHCARELRANHTSPLLASLWRLLIFQAPLSLTILSQHICAGAFSFCLYLHIKAHFFFIFIKEKNGNFPKSPNLCNSQSGVFWRFCV